MALTTQWVGYLTRSAQQIKASLISRLRTEVPEVTDLSPSNILIVILDMFAGVAEMLGLYIDNMAREAFIATARRYTSMVKHTRLLDYRIKAATGASAELTLTFNTPSIADYLLPVGTTFKTSSGIPFITTKTNLIALGSSGATIGVAQITQQSNYTLGTTTAAANQVFNIPDSYVHDTMSILINSVVWTLTQTLGLKGPTDKVFIVDIDTDGIAKVVFGDGTNGEIPPAGFSVVGNFYTTLAELGNVANDTITQAVSTINVPGVTTITITNLNNATGGSSYETVERLRKSAPLSIRTLDRAVTRQDYIDIAKLAPGVAKAALFFNCGKTIKIYIVPLSGGIASSVLLNTTKNWIDARRTITTFVEVLPAGQSYVRLRADLTPRFLVDPIQTETDARAALASFFSLTAQDVNKKIRLSDVYAVIDNLARVDFLTITHLSVNPYARPYNHSIQLNWTREVLEGSTAITTWTLEYLKLSGIEYVKIFKANNYLGLHPLGTDYTDPNNIIKFRVNFNPSYTNGKQWTFTVYPINMDIPLDDYTIPTYDDSFVEFNMLTQQTEEI